MAIGVVIGAAFSKIVSSFVADIITPLISLITKEGTPIKDKFLVLGNTKG
ncbi:MAG TPA: MscL family protein, partial [Clostridia bacterium]|nr:MscL family protein [Clostridia bacterium]